jgi:hypothetical protein
LADWRVVALSGVLTAGFLLFFTWTESLAPEGTPGVIELELAFSAERFYDIVEDWTRAGTLEIQRRNLWLDLLFPFAYATLLSGLLGSLARPPSDWPGSGWTVLLMLPLVAGALDWVENGLLLWLLESMDGQRQMAVTLASVVASAKWILILVSLIAALVLFLGRIIQAIRGREKETVR